MEFAQALSMPEDAELSDVALGYWAAWHLLNCERQLGAMGGASRIPWSKIAEYASDYLFDDEFTLARVMWAMDEVYLEWLAAKQERPET